MPRLCAFGCPPNDLTMHRFPNWQKFPDRFKTWVTLVGGKLETEADFQFYVKKRVCDIHFTDRDRNRNSRLNALAVPTLYLSGRYTESVNVAQNPGNADTVTINMDISPTLDTVSGKDSRLSSVAQVPADTVSTATVDKGIGSLLGTNQDYLHHPQLVDACSIRMEHNYSVVSRQDRLSKGTNKKLIYHQVPSKPFHSTILRMRSEISRLRKRSQSFKARLASVEKISEDVAFSKLIDNMTKPAQLFVKMQIQASKKPKGRRFSLAEKILSLSLFKKSPKCYALMYKYFTLPSSKAMKRLLSQIKLTPGINPIIFEKIGKTVKEMDRSDRICSLMFDEMSLTPQVFFNVNKDTLEGFTSNTGQQFADHVLVFMVKGLKHNFKQPVAYYFTNCLKKMELKNTIKIVAKHVLECGLIILNTVCDQSTVNIGAITELINEMKATYLRLNKEWRYDSFCVTGHNIIPLFDVPHLIKGIRNNIINKNMSYIYNNEKKIVKWNYYQMVYGADKAYGELRLLNKLTEEHVNPDKINKMRVKTATQLLSHSVAVVTEHLTARGDLPQECRQLIDITILLDNLFDSLNGNSLYLQNGKIFKGPVKSRSPHHELWQKAKIVLRTVKFIKSSGVGVNVRLIETSVPSVVNLIKTIEGMEAIWRILYNKYGFDALLTRNLNQDPLENFFGNIRSYGARNNAPNTMAFEGAFKALLLNNYNLPHSKFANCESDTNECLETLNFFLKEKYPNIPKEVEPNIVLNNDILTQNLRNVDAGQRNYVCGWILTKCLKNVIKSCQQCKETLLDSRDRNTNNIFIKRKEYANKKWLCYPSKELENCFHDVQNITESFLIKKDVLKIEIKKTISTILNMMVEFPFSCNMHKDEVRKYFISQCINIFLFSWCRTINRILCGKYRYVGDDENKKAAQEYYNKHKHNKNKK